MPPAKPFTGHNECSRYLLLIRHAKTRPAGPGQPDIERELNPEGLRQAAAIRAWLDENLPQGPWLVLCSPAVRARQTWRNARPEAVDDKTRYVDRIYNGSAGTLHALCGDYLADHARLMLIGHNPSISELLAMLAPDQPEAGRGLGIGDLALLGNDQASLNKPWRLAALFRP